MRALFRYATRLNKTKPRQDYPKTQILATWRQYFCTAPYIFWITLKYNNLKEFFYGVAIIRHHFVLRGPNESEQLHQETLFSQPLYCAFEEQCSISQHKGDLRCICIKIHNECHSTATLLTPHYLCTLGAPTWNWDGGGSGADMRLASGHSAFHENKVTNKKKYGEQCCQPELSAVNSIMFHEMRS